MWQGTGTDLYYDHADSEHVRFSCDRTSSLENLWCGPCRLHRSIYSANGRGKFKIRQTSVAIVIDKNIGLAEGCR